MTKVNNVMLAQAISEATGVTVSRPDVSNFKNKRFNFIGKAKRKAIKKYFIAQGVIAPPAPKPKCICPTCGKQYVKK